ncbi:hypothetical protein KI688_004195 [Linnemannia hyalina]|uniref:Uncharacterized protein n=1 Tax=Linnemannia hyalina TaxID=64524 RepID=A0A9P7XNE7_9FUNG|nr:hypothetical protein KI688_004195 [Linnemannia hyalina]
MAPTHRLLFGQNAALLKEYMSQPPQLRDMALLKEARTNMSGIEERSFSLIQEYHHNNGAGNIAVMMPEVTCKPTCESKSYKDYRFYPRSAVGMELFLESASLAIIWNFRSALEAQGPVLQSAYDKKKATAEIQKHELGVSIPREKTPKLQIRALKNHVVLSPARHHRT